jgi:hypothetical protein
MIKHINTKEDTKEDFFDFMKTMKSGLSDEKIYKEIIDPIFNNYDECLYKLSTDTCIAYKPKNSDFWVENSENNIIYVESHTTPRNTLIQEVAKSKGIPLATIIVNKWFEDYSAFLFDTNISDNLYTLDRFRGTWNLNTQNIMKYKM